MIRVGVVASGMAMRIGLREVLNHLAGLTVVAEAPRFDEIPADEADVLVVASPANFHSRSSTPAILLLTDDPTDLQELLEMNPTVWGVLALDANENELESAIMALSEGLWVGAPILLSGLIQRGLPRKPEDPDLAAQPLTRRELEVLQLTAQGLANKQIAVALDISEHTVKFHLSALYAKLGVTSRTEAVRAGARQGLVVL